MTCTVIDDNCKLLRDSAKAGRLAVKLARERYFGNVVMRVKTLSALDKKIKAIKEKLGQVYNFGSHLEFEPVW